MSEKFHGITVGELRGKATKWRQRAELPFGRQQATRLAELHEEAARALAAVIEARRLRRRALLVVGLYVLPALALALLGAWGLAR